jgi:ubiquinone/menaquinone biosynthesis C-methylase UbiE
MPMDSRDHWETIYGTKAATDVSWYQLEATVSLQLIRQVAPSHTAAILDVGGGASTLVDSLVSLHYSNITVLDIAANALASARARLGSKAERVRWIAGDALAIDLPDHSIDVWHDRAVFHFLLSAEDRRRYVAQVKRVLRNDGHVIIATFAEDGPTRCSGLPVERYNAEQLHGEFGDEFRLLTSVRERHITPGGTHQSFRYCLCSYAAGSFVTAYEQP